RHRGPSDAHVSAVDRAVRQLIEDDRVVERTMLGTRRYLFPASPAVRGSTVQFLGCFDCDLRWVSELGAPHVHCWSCGEQGRPITSHTGRIRSGRAGLPQAMTTSEPRGWTEPPDREIDDPPWEASAERH